MKTESHHIVNHYLCPCGNEWTDTWSCGCNDRCSECNKEIEPYASDDGSMTSQEIADSRQAAEQAQARSLNSGVSKAERMSEVDTRSVINNTLEWARIEHPTPLRNVVVGLLKERLHELAPQLVNGTANLGYTSIFYTVKTAALAKVREDFDAVQAAIDKAFGEAKEDMALSNWLKCLELASALPDSQVVRPLGPRQP